MRRTRTFCLLIALTSAACKRSESDPTPAPQQEPVALGQVRWLKRARWVPAWSAYRDVTSATDAAPAVRAPAAGATAVLVDLDGPNAPEGGVPATMGGTRASLLDQATPLPLKVGEVVELTIAGDAAEAVGIAGDGAEGYWTIPARKISFKNGAMVETPFASLYLQGRSPGRSEITVKKRDGGEHRVAVVVAP